MTWEQQTSDSFNTFINYKYSNIKYYTIKLLIESIIEKSSFAKRLFKKYGASQLLFTYFCSTLINNMFYNKNNIMANYRIFIGKLGRWNIHKDCYIPMDNICNYMHEHSISCCHDIFRVFKKSFFKLFILYSKLSLVSILYKLYKKKQIKLLPIIAGIIKSTSFLSLLGTFYRIIVCSCAQFNKDDKLPVFTSQYALSIGSLAFQFESVSRRPIINKYILSLYIHDLTSQLGLTNINVWKYIFMVALLYSIKSRSITKTLISLIL